MSTTHQTNARFKDIEVQVEHLIKFCSELQLRVNELEIDLERQKQLVKTLNRKIDKVYP